MWVHAAYKQVRFMDEQNVFCFKKGLSVAYSQVRVIVRNLRYVKKKKVCGELYTHVNTFDGNALCFPLCVFLLAIYVIRDLSNLKTFLFAYNFYLIK